MRLIFCGSGAFAVPAFGAILKAGHEVARVVTQPARPVGRHGTPQGTPLGEAARAAGVAVDETANINAPESVAAFRAIAPQVIVVADFGQFVRAPVRETAALGAFNLHGSLLPELRGAAPVAWAIIRGCKVTGVTTFSLVDKMDAGAIYLQAQAEINPDETAEELRMRLAVLGADLVCRTLDRLAAGDTQGTVQDESRVTMAPKLQKADGVLDWSADAVSLRNRIHGTWPWPAGHAVLVRKDGRAVPVLMSRAATVAGDSPLEGGTLDADLLVATGKGRLRIVEIQPAGKRVMSWKDFVNGQRLSAGDKFIKPPEVPVL